MHRELDRDARGARRDEKGIGLSVSRSIIQRHEGRLWSVPNEGPGATFSFSVPADADTKV